MSIKNQTMIFTSPDKLYKSLQKNIILGLSITSLVIGTISAYLLYRTEIKQLETELAFNIELQTLTLQSKVTLLKNVSTQIASRSGIRQKLEKYLNHEIDLNALVTFSIPKLTDAMLQAPEIKAINRLDINGNVLIEAGGPIPATAWPTDFLSDTTQLGRPLELNDYHILVVSTPIFNRQHKKVGIDLIAFDTKIIINIINDFIPPQQNSTFIKIVAPGPNGVNHIYQTNTETNKNINELINAEIKKVIKGESITLHSINDNKQNLIMLHHNIGDSGWIYLFFKNADEFHAPVINHLIYLAAAILILTLTGIFLTLRLVRPMSQRITSETKHVRQLLQNNNKLLSKVRLSENRLQSILDNADAVIYIKDWKGKFLLVNKRFNTLFADPHKDLSGKNVADIFPKDIADAHKASDKEVFDKAIPMEYNEHAPHKDGIHYYHSFKFPLYDESGNIYGVCSISTDITARKQLEQRERLRLKTLEMITQGLPLYELLENIVHLVEAEISGVTCSILMLDKTGKHLHTGAAPSLPDFYNEAIDGVEIGHGVGSCGTAAFDNQTVIVKNIQQHPYWQLYTELASRAGLAACWSEPIRDGEGKVLGTFAMYFNEPRSPEKPEIKLINQLSQLISIAIENKTKEKALLDSEERFNLAMRAANDGLWDWDIKTNTVYYSPRWKAMLGYEEHELTHHFNTWQQLANPDDISQIITLVEKCKNGEQNGFSTEYRLQHKQGHWVHVLVQAIVVRNKEGKAIRFVGTHTDISKRITAEKALKNSESRLRTIFDFAHDGIALVDIETKQFMDANPAFYHMTGYTQHDLSSMTVEQIHPEAERNEIMSQFESRALGEMDETAEDISILCKDGHIFSADINASLLEIDNRPCLLGFFRDISHRKQTEQELENYRDNLENLVILRTRELEELTLYNRTLFKTTPIGLALCDLEGKLVDVNPAYLKIIGYDESEAKKLPYWDITPIKYEAQDREQLDKLKSNGHYGPYEKEYVHKDGHLVPVQLSGLTLEQNGKQFIWSTVEDITERRAVQAALTDAKQKAEIASKAKSDFLANMSHEIRTPLNALLGLARMGKRCTSPDKTQEIFTRISESGQNLFRVVNDILDFSKIEANKLVLDIQPFNLHSSIQNLANLIKTQIEDKRLVFTFEIADEVPTWVEGDALRLEQILLNLLSNAIKFTEKGEIRLLIVQHNTQLQFQVHDTGIGMSSIQLEQLFKPFEQADSSTTRRYGGTGLGLSISQNLAILMGGEIQVESQLNQGSHFIFNVTMEATTPIDETFSEISSTTYQKLHGINILAAEDIEVNRIVLDDMLTREGANLMFAENGQQAIDILKKQGANAFDIVLMDIQMPIMGGYEATEKILKLAPSMPIIGLTAHALLKEKNRCLSAGMVDHIAKPIDEDSLVRAIQKHTLSTNNSSTQTNKKAEHKTTTQTLPETADEIIDWPALHTRYQHREKIIKKLINTTLRTHHDTAEKLRLAVTNNDATTVNQLSHTLNGIAGFLEASPLRQLAMQSEEETLNGNTENIQLGNELATHLEKFIDQLSDIMQQESPE